MKKNQGSSGPRRRPSRQVNRKDSSDAPSRESGETRLNKYLAHAGIASRREADELIKTGLVEVNGKTVTEMGYKVKKGDVVRFNGSQVQAEKLVYYALNKPRGFITTTDDPSARKTVMDLMAQTGPERIYPVGRLDRKTTGILLLTNDGDLAKKLTHPSHGARKIYQVTLDKNLDKADFHAIQEGLTLNDGPIQVDDIAYVEGKSRKNVGLVLHSGRNRIVRRIFEHLNYEVTQLDRVFFAGITKKNLRRGQWRRLSEQEVNFLKMH
jgi:pseudouridine synthase